MTILRFNLEDVRTLVKATLGRGTGFRLNGNQSCDPFFAKPGVVIDEGYGLQPDQVDHAKVPPALWLVKDDGIYLLSNSVGCKLVVYAEGFGCDADYDAVRAAVGGDDFCDALPLDALLKNGIFSDGLKDYLFVGFSSNALDLYVEKKQKPRTTR